MNPAVHLESRVLSKPSPTLGALIRLCTCMDSLMQQQRSFGAECLSTVGADIIHIIPFMYLFLMANNILLSFEGLWAVVAGMKPLGAVDVLFMSV